MGCHDMLSNVASTSLSISYQYHVTLTDKIQDTMTSRTGPRKKGLSWEIQDGWSPYCQPVTLIRSFVLDDPVFFERERQQPNWSDYRLDRTQIVLGRQRSEPHQPRCAVWPGSSAGSYVNRTRFQHSLYAGGPDHKVIWCSLTGIILIFKIKK